MNGLKTVLLLGLMSGLLLVGGEALAGRRGLIIGLRRMDLPTPRLWAIPDESPNAFATGRNPKHASVAVTAGILRLMNDREIEGVLAHELGHVKHRDISPPPSPRPSPSWPGWPFSSVAPVTMTRARTRWPGSSC